MSALSIADRRNLERLLGMSSGYVLDFSDRTFGEFVDDVVGIDIHAEKYTVDGTSKARKLRVLWRLESNYTVGTLLTALIEHSMSVASTPTKSVMALANQCRLIEIRLLASGPSLSPLKEVARIRDAAHLVEQIGRLEAAVQSDPSLAIGTAKELIETTCRTILAERGKPVAGTPDISNLTKQCLKELALVPEDIADAARGKDVIRRLLSNLGTIGNGLAELRGLYGTGHGKVGSAVGLQSRHAKLAVGAAATLATFLFETHAETQH